MKSFKQALTMGAIGALAVFTASYLGIPTWVLFIAWTSYYLFGTKIKNAFLVFVQQTLGILIAMIIQYFGIYFSEILGISGFSIVVFIVMIGVFYISKLKYLNNIPAYFLGMIIWFGSSAEISINIFLLLVTALVFGYIFAYVNVSINRTIELKQRKSELYE